MRLSWISEILKRIWIIVLLIVMVLFDEKADCLFFKRFSRSSRSQNARHRRHDVLSSRDANAVADFLGTSDEDRIVWLNGPRNSLRGAVPVANVGSILGFGDEGEDDDGGRASSKRLLDRRTPSSSSSSSSHSNHVISSLRPGGGGGGSGSRRLATPTRRQRHRQQKKLNGSPRDVQSSSFRIEGYADKQVVSSLYGQGKKTGRGKSSSQQQQGHHHHQKREYDPIHSKLACPSNITWVRPEFAHNTEGYIVKVLQPRQPNVNFQWFQVVNCIRDHNMQEDRDCPNCCRGIDRSRYESRCETKHVYLHAFVHRKTRQGTWNETITYEKIRIASGCACEISPVT